MSTKTIINANLGVFCMEMQEAVLDGWRVNPDNPPNMLWTYYEAELVKDDVVQDAVYASLTDIQEQFENKFPVQAPVKKMGRPSKAV